MKNKMILGILLDSVLTLTSFAAEPNLDIESPRTFYTNGQDSFYDTLTVMEVQQLVDAKNQPQFTPIQMANRKTWLIDPLPSSINLNNYYISYFILQGKPFNGAVSNFDRQVYHYLECYFIPVYKPFYSTIQKAYVQLPYTGFPIIVISERPQ